MKSVKNLKYLIIFVFVFSFLIFLLFMFLFPSNEFFSCNTSNHCSYRASNAFNITLQKAEFNLKDVLSIEEARYILFQGKQKKRFPSDRDEIGASLMYWNPIPYNSQDYRIKYNDIKNETRYINPNSNAYYEMESYYKENKTTSFKNPKGFTYDKKTDLIPVILLVFFVVFFMCLFVLLYSPKSQDK